MFERQKRWLRAPKPRAMVAKMLSIVVIEKKLCEVHRNLDVCVIQKDAYVLYLDSSLHGTFAAATDTIVDDDSSMLGLKSKG